MAGLSGDHLGHRHALVLGLMRQHRAVDDVADGVDVVDAAAEVIVGDHPTRFIEGDAHVLKAETLGQGTSADREQHDVGIQGFVLAARRRLQGQAHPLGRGLGAGHLG